MRDKQRGGERERDKEDKDNGTEKIYIFNVAIFFSDRCSLRGYKGFVLVGGGGLTQHSLLPPSGNTHTHPPTRDSRPSSILNISWDEPMLTNSRPCEQDSLTNQSARESAEVAGCQYPPSCKQ